MPDSIRNSHVVALALLSASSIAPAQGFEKRTLTLDEAEAVLPADGRPAR